MGKCQIVSFVFKQSNSSNLKIIQSYTIFQKDISR